MDHLIELKVVHRLESLNAWTTCCDTNHDSAPVFVICDDCGNVKEHIDLNLNLSLQNISKKSGFVAERPIIEIHGRCEDCDTGTGGWGKMREKIKVPVTLLTGFIKSEKPIYWIDQNKIGVLPSHFKMLTRMMRGLLSVKSELHE